MPPAPIVVSLAGLSSAMLSDLLKWGGKRLEQAQAGAARGVSAQTDEPVVGSKAFPKFLSALNSRPSPVLLDFGPVIGTNVEFFGDRLGCKLFIEDIIGDIDRHTRAGTLDALPKAFETRFRHADASVDGILCWDVFDFLDKHAAPALARQVIRMLRPGGAVLALFTVANKQEHASFTKYEIVDEANLRHRQHAGVGGVKKVLQNRDIIRMFEGLAVSDSFLLKSNTREMLLRRR
jgi:predicted SAM-dependent methyltransferase